MKQKFALVTWSSRWIGRAIALTLAKEGYNIIVHYNVREDKAIEVSDQIKKIGVKCFLIQANLCNKNEIKKIFDKINKFTDKLDLLVNNAWFDYDKTIEDYSLEEIQSVIDLVLTSKIIITKLALPLLNKSNNPSIVNIASRMGINSMISKIAPYASAEAGVVRFTEACVFELSWKYNLRINTIAPWLTDTDYTRLYLSDQKNWDEIAKNNPMKRVGRPQDVANLVSFLASEKAEYINWEFFHLTGGSHVF